MALKPDQLKILLYIARILGVLASALALYFIIAIGFREAEENKQLITINYLLIFLMFGFLIAWFRAREGGIILSFGTVIMYLYVVYMPDIVGYFWLYVAFFFLSGIVFLWYDFEKRKVKMGD